MRRALLVALAGIAVAGVARAATTTVSTSIEQIRPDGSGHAVLETLAAQADLLQVSDPEHVLLAEPSASGATAVVLDRLSDGRRQVLGELADRVVTASAHGDQAVAATCPAQGRCDSQLWLLRAGSAPRAFANIDGEAGNPEQPGSGIVWSPDGRTLAVWSFVGCSYRGDSSDCNTFRLWLVSPTGGWVRPVGHHGRLASFSPDGRYLAYVGVVRGDPEDNVLVYDLRRGTIRRLGRGNIAAWSPKSDALAFGGLSTLRLFANGAIRTLAGGVVPRTFGWSPNGRMIAFACLCPPKTKRPRVAVLTLGGRSIRLAGPQADGIALIAWSPDSRRLAWVGAGPSATARVFAATVGGRARPLLTTDENSTSVGPLWWSRAGDEIRFVFRRYS